MDLNPIRNKKNKLSDKINSVKLLIQQNKIVQVNNKTTSQQWLTFYALFHSCDNSRD